jgi:hypothetical protein
MRANHALMTCAAADLLLAMWSPRLAHKPQGCHKGGRLPINAAEGLRWLALSRRKSPAGLAFPLYRPRL